MARPELTPAERAAYQDLARAAARLRKAQAAAERERQGQPTRMSAARTGNRQEGPANEA